MTSVEHLTERTILGLTRPEKFASVDMGIYGHLTRRNLAALAAERGDREEKARLWRAVLAECPDDREARAQPIAPASIPMREVGIPEVPAIGRHVEVEPVPR